MKTLGRWLPSVAEPLPASLVSVVAVCAVVAAGSGLFALGVSYSATTVQSARLSVEVATLAAPPSSLADLNVTVVNSGRASGTISANVRSPTGQTPLIVGGAYPAPPGKRIQAAFQINNVEQFGGLGGSVATPNSASLNPRNFTLEFEFEYAAFLPDPQQIIGKGGTAGNSFYFYSYRSTNNINDFVIYEDGTRFDQQLGNIFSPGTWYNLALTVNGSFVAAYVDGSLASSWTHSVEFLGNDDPLVLGACGCGGYSFNGSLADVVMYNRALSPSEVAVNYATPGNPLKTGLVLWYDFAPSATGTVADLSGWNNSGVASGDVASVSPIQVGTVYTVAIDLTATTGIVDSEVLSLRAE